MIRAGVQLDIARPAGEVFAYIDDIGRAPEWLSQCAEITQTTAGPKGVGTGLRYRYREGGPRQGTMDGEVIAYEPGRTLGMRFTDAMFDLEIGFDVTPAAAGAHVDHHVEIEPKGMAKLMAPMIRGAVQKQIEQDTATLKQRLESGA